MNPADLRSTRRTLLLSRSSLLEQSERSAAIALGRHKMPVGLMLGQWAKNDHTVLQSALKLEVGLNGQRS